LIWNKSFLNLFFILFLLSAQPLHSLEKHFYQNHLKDFSALLYDSKKDRVFFYGEQDRNQLIYPGSVLKIFYTAQILKENSKWIHQKVYCEGYQPKKPFPLECHERHGQVTLKQALAKSCNAFYKSFLADNTFNKSRHFLKNYQINYKPYSEAEPINNWSLFLGVDDRSQLSAWQLLKALQILINSPEYSQLRPYLVQAKKEGTTKRLNQFSKANLIGKTGTKLISKKALGVFVGWENTLQPAYYIIVKSNDSRGQDWPIIFAGEIVEEYLAH
jgi:beta-lactamase class D